MSGVAEQQQGFNPESVCLPGGSSDIGCGVEGSEGVEGREASGRVLHGADPAGRRHHRDAVHEGGDVRAAAARHPVRTSWRSYVYCRSCDC